MGLVTEHIFGYWLHFLVQSLVVIIGLVTGLAVAAEVCCAGQVTTLKL